MVTATPYGISSRVRLIRDGVRREERAALGEELADHVDELRHVLAGQRRQRIHLAERERRRPRLHEWQQHRLRDQVDLREHEDHRLLRARHVGQQLAVVRPDGIDRLARSAVRLRRPAGLREVQDHVDLAHGGERGLHHRPVQQVGGPVHAGGVEEAQLRARCVDDAQEPGARGLRPRGDDGEVLSHQRVQEGALPDVRSAEQERETGAVRTGRRPRELDRRRRSQMRRLLRLGALLVGHGCGRVARLRTLGSLRSRRLSLRRSGLRRSGPRRSGLRLCGRRRLRPTAGGARARLPVLLRARPGAAARGSTRLLLIAALLQLRTSGSCHGALLLSGGRGR